MNAKLFTNEDVLSVAETAIFLWQGITDAVAEKKHSQRTPEENALYDLHFDGHGQAGIAFQVGEIAMHLHEAEKKWKEYDYPGAYAYEIVEPLGTWLTQQGVPLASLLLAEIVQHYEQEMREWIVSSAVADKLTATSALAAHNPRHCGKHGLIFDGNVHKQCPQCHPKP